jgi:hypothetical protein
LCGYVPISSSDSYNKQGAWIKANKNVALYPKPSILQINVLIILKKLIKVLVKL